MKLYYATNIFIIGLIFFASCGVSDNKKASNIKTDSIGITDEPKEELQEKPIVKSKNKIYVSKINKIRILNFEKSIDKGSAFYLDYFPKCESWKLDTNEIAEILQKSKIIDGHEFQYYFSIIPCYYNGKVIINDSISNFNPLTTTIRQLINSKHKVSSSL